MSEQNIHIIRKCIQGDRLSQKEFFKQYNKQLFAISLKYMQDRNDAEEVLQDSWISIFNSLKNYTEEGNLNAWMKTIVIRTAWKAIRKKTNFKELDKINDPFGKSLDIQIINKMTCDEVLNLLQFVPAASRQVFKMFVLDEYDHSEIAEILNINNSTSRAHLTKARKLLKEKFDGLNKIAHNGLKAI